MGELSVRGFVPDGSPYDSDPLQPSTVLAMAAQLARREDQRLVGIVASSARLPFPVRVMNRPDLFALQVGVPGHVLVTVTREYMDRANVDSTTLAVMIGRQARRVWFATPALPVPSNVVLGEN